MDAKLLLDNFETIAEAPGGVAKLRELILSLAVTGKLVEKDLTDEPAEVLLGRIGDHRTRFVANGDAKPLRSSPTASFSARESTIPPNWSWARMEELTIKLGAGSTPLGGKESYLSQGIKFIRSQNVWNDGLRLADVALISLATHESMAATCVRPKDILLNITGASIGRSALVPEDFDEANVSQHVAIVRPVVPEIRQYLHLFLISPLGQGRIMDVQVGISREGLSMSRLVDFQVPLPPLAEQHRIVAKVDELMALCDELEQRQQKRHKVRQSLQTSALDALTSADSPEALAKAWQRARDNWQAITGHPDCVPTMRQAILSLALCGHLTNRDPADESAGVTLSKKYQLPHGYTRLRKTVNNTKIALDSVHYPELPDSWRYVTVDGLYDAGVIIDFADGNHGSFYPRKHDFSDVGTIFVTAQQIVAGEVDLARAPRLKNEIANKLTKGWATGGDILFTHNATVGRVARVPRETGRFLLGTSATFYRLNEMVLDRDFFFYCLMGPPWQEQAQAVMAQTTRNQVSIQKQAFFLVPFAPIHEQKAIANKLDVLMSLCDALESQLKQRQENSTQLAETVVRSIMPATVLRPTTTSAGAEDEKDADDIEEHCPVALRNTKGIGRHRSKADNGGKADQPELLQLLVETLKQGGELTSAQVQEFSGLDATEAGTLLKQLVASGKAEQVGQKRGTRYRWRR